MKFIVNSSTLLKHLSAINGVVTTNPVVPILENFLIEIKDGVLTVTGSDLQTSMMTEIELEAKEDGNIAVPASRLTDTLKNVSEQQVTFSIDNDTYSIEISSDNVRYKLAGENATDFSQIPAVTHPPTVDMSTEVLSSAINNTI